LHVKVKVLKQMAQPLQRKLQDNPWIGHNVSIKNKTLLKVIIIN